MESYDDVPYPGSPFAQTHPDRLATHALLFGLEPAPPSRCRVLELGCGDGENLVPMAAALPGSRFVGVDLAEHAVAQARSLAGALGLANVELHAADLREVSPAWGRFDYVIAHGVWSWVPGAVRVRILEICRELLTPNGVAYVSYDVLPGGHVRQMVRDMLLYHARGAQSERARIAAARELLPLLAPAGGPGTPYHAVLRAEAETLAKRSDGALFHDDLSEDHVHEHFHAFVSRARGYGLQYLAEAELVAMNEGRAPAELRALLGERKMDRVEREQYLDFATGRRFRQTLLCRAGLALADAPGPESVARLFAAGRATSDAAEEDLLSDRPVRFGFAKEGSVEIWHPVAKLALVELARRWPETLAVPDLVKQVRTRRGVSDPADRTVVHESLLALYGASLVELHAEDSAARAAVSARPRASALARHQVARGRLVTTLRHERVHIADDLSAKLLALLDGTRDAAALVDALAAHAPAAAVDGFATPAPGGSLRDELAATLPGALASLAGLGLLEA